MTRTQWADLRAQYLDGVAARHRIRLRLCDHVWCVTEAGEWVALPGVTATANPDQWWLVYRRDKFRERRAIGAILLCASPDPPDQPLLDFGLPESLITSIEPHLARGSSKADLHFNVFRRGDRFQLQLKGVRPLDITECLGNLSWLRNATASRGEVA